MIIDKWPMSSQLIDISGSGQNLFTVIIPIDISGNSKPVEIQELSLDKAAYLDIIFANKHDYLLKDCRIPYSLSMKQIEA